jgi:hypothetical protein
MRVQYFLLAAACAVCLLALPQPHAPAEPQLSAQVDAMQIDFDALRAEAKGALEALQHSREPRVAWTDTGEF